MTTSSSIINVLDEGADPTGHTPATDTIQSAFDKAHAAGGGTVLIPEGRYVVTSLELASGVTLQFEEGATLTASKHRHDYSRNAPIISALDAENISLQGPGIIEGGGHHFYEENGRLPTQDYHPLKILRFDGCENLLIQDLTLRDSLEWTCAIVDCDHATVRNLTIRNPQYAQAGASDGIDIVASRHVLVENCDIETGDDGICLKNFLGEDVPIERHPPMHDVTVRDCTVASTCNATKIGTETVGEIRGILLERITVRKHSRADAGNPIQSGACIAAISIQSNDGAKVHHITCRGYLIEQCDTPVFLLLQERKSLMPSGLGELRSIDISNIVCKRAEACSQVNVSEGGRIHDVKLSGLNIHNFEATEHKAAPPRPCGSYPDAHKYGPMPAFGLFARSITGLSLHHKIEFHDTGKSGRPMILLEDVANLDDTGVNG